MKKLSFLLFLTFVGIFVFAQNNQGKEIKLRSTDQAKCIQNDMKSMRAEFGFSTIKTANVDTKMGAFSVLEMANTYESGNIGEPTLPAIHELVAVPFGATPKVTITNFSVEEYDLNSMGINKLMPRQPSLRKDMNPDEVEFVYNEKAYQTRGLASLPKAEIEVTGTMRGVRMGSLLINNVSYDAVANKIRVFNNIEVEVSFDGANIEETENMLVDTYSPYFAPVYKQLFNSRAINDVYTDHPDLWAAPVRMIVITPSSLQSALEPWLEWKTQKGFYVDVYTTEQTGTTNNAIKTYIQNLYNTGVQAGETPTFLVVVGDIGQVPASATSGSQTQRASDLYYQSVDNDYFPDMFYSRMSATSATQVTNIVNKILMYEKYTMPDPSYLDNVLLIAGWDSSWNPRVAQPTINYGTTNYFNAAHGYSNVYTYLTQGQYSGCYNNLSTGVGFANYTAHGSETSWSDPYFSNSNVNALTNTNKYFLAIGNCCNSGDFGYSECFGEAMIRAENKAAFSYIGSCPYSYWYEDYYFSVGATTTFYSAPSYSSTSTGAYDGMFIDETYNTVNSILFLGNLAVTYASTNGYQYSVGPLYYWQAYHVLGDGSVMPYNTNPSANTVNHAATFPLNTSTFTVSAVEGSYVAISKDNVLLGTALVGNSGSVNVPVTPVTQSGDVMIVVTRPQRQPYITTIPTSGGGGGTPNVVFNSCSPTTIGVNNNTNISVTMINNGTAATSGNTTVTLSTSDSYLTIVNNSASYGTMAVNATASNTYVVRAAANTPDNHVTTINVNAANGGNNWSSSFTLTISNPCNAPTGLNATANGNNIHLTWNASSTALSYKLYRGNTLIASPTTTSYNDNNLNYSQQYCYTVKSVCNVGESNASNQACATTEDEPCLAPTRLNATANGTDISLSWTASVTADSYKIYRGTELIGSATTNSYADNGLQYSTEYCYHVTSVCNGEESDSSNEACATTENEPCNAPSNLETSLVDMNNIVLTWDAVENAVSYTIARDGVVIANDVIETTYTDSDLTNGTYCYTVASVCSAGQSDASEESCTTIENDGIDEYARLFQIVPNPVNDQLIIFTEENIREISIYNIVGVSVYNDNQLNDNRIYLNNINEGMYFIKITTDRGDVVKRFIKRR